MDYDLVVIGGGSGGVRGARVAASLGARVALIEASALGGTCVNVGCVPKKLLAYGAKFGESLTDMRGYGWSPGAVTFDWPALVAAKDLEIERLNGAYGRMLGAAGVEVIPGFARVTGPTEVTVGDRVIRAPKLLVATGGRPWRPSPEDLPGVELTWTSDDLFRLPTLPRRLVIVGAGYIACEFASIFRGFDVQVEQGYRGHLPLRGFDDDIRAALAEALVERGITLHPGVVPVGIARADKALRVEWSDGTAHVVDGVLMATGRVPNTDRLGLADVGVALAPDGGVIVDDAFRTNVPSIWAVGDVIDRVALTPVALAEAMVFAHQQFGDGREMDYRDVPSAVFTSPQIGTVGFTEVEARAKLGPIDVYTSTFKPMVHQLTGRARRSYLKLIVEQATDRLVGMHVLDADAAEITQGFAAAMKAGITKAQLDRTIGIHPTVAEELVTMRTKRPELVPPGPGASA
ncbi:MAG: glutathione-disulfide reductase [Myxococcota bacterium]